MKEITIEEWMKNPTPREMWVWDTIYAEKKVRKVIYYNDNKECRYPVSCLSEDRTKTNVYQHCAEIEEEEEEVKRMTNYELAKWLYEGARCGEFREYRFIDASIAYHDYTYVIDGESENKPCSTDIRIRVNGGEWREPLKESEE